MKQLLLLFLMAGGMLFASRSAGNFLEGTHHLSAEGARFSWEHAEDKSLRILVEYRDTLGEWRATELGSGFLISSEGYFVTAYHVMKYCLVKKKTAAGFSDPVACSNQSAQIRYKALNR